MTIDEATDAIRTEKTYYDRNHPVGRLPSNSSIGKLVGGDPREFLLPFPNHINLTKGSYFHDLCTQPEVAKEYHIISDDMHRGSKEYKDLVIELGFKKGEVLMKRSEALQMETLADKMKEKSFFKMIMSQPDTLIEEPYIVKKYGVYWKMKQDIVIPSLKLCVDLKTSSADDFGDSCYKWGYHSQGSLYLTPHGEDWTFLFYVANKESGEIQMYEPSKEMLDAGDERVAKAARIYTEWKEYFDKQMI